jgi:hypothetical protein
MYILHDELREYQSSFTIIEYVLGLMIRWDKISKQLSEWNLLFL